MFFEFMKYIIYILIFMSFAPTASAANLTMHQISDNQISLELNSSEAVNAVSAQVKFNPKLVSVESLSFDRSFCQLFVEEKIDNINGVVSIQCGRPSPGLTGQGTVGELRFKSAADSVNFDFLKSSQVLANDGYGTELLHQVSGITVYQLRNINLGDPVYQKPDDGQVLIEDSLLFQNLV